MKTKRQKQIGRQLRRETRERKAQARFIESPTPRKAGRIAGAQANKEYRPVLRGLRSEVAGSNKREGELKDWYGGLTAQNQAAQQSAAASSQAAETALTQRLANASASDSANLKDLASKNEATGKLLGTNQVGASNAASNAAGATSIAQQRVALTSPLTAERASQQGYLAQRGISATERGIEARKSETSRRRKIKEDLRAGKKERGQAVTANLERLREGARDYAIQKQAFGQKSRESALSARQDAADRRLKAREGAADRAIDIAKVGQGQRKIKNEERKIRNEEREKPDDDKREGRRNASATARSLYDQRKWKSWSQLERAVRKESEVSPAEARAAVARLRKRAEGQERDQRAADLQRNYPHR